MANVLIVDDEECILKMAALYLNRRGHTTVPCASAESALLQFTAFQGSIDLLIADVSLGISSGVEVGMQLLEMSPTLKVVFLSGYPVGMWSNRDAALLGQLPRDAVRVLQKPFAPPDLLLKIDELIGRTD